MKIKVYGVYILMYEVRKNKAQTREVHSVKTAGAYNTRHLFMYFNGSHYQPMTPNDFYGLDFQSPRVTAKATEAYEGSMIIPIPRTPRKGKKEVADGIAHPWRRAEGGRKVAPPVPVDRMFSWNPFSLLYAMSHGLPVRHSQSGNYANDDDKDLWRPGMMLTVTIEPKR